MVDFKFADETEVKVAHLMTPELANFYGNVHGGHVLYLVDNLAFVCAARFSGQTCVTAAVDRVDFHEPVRVGELLHLRAVIAYVGRTSMDVEITVHAEDIRTGVMRHTNTCYLTVVAVENGKPTPVPRLVFRTREDKARFIQAKMRRELGIRHREETRQFLQQFESMTDQELDGLIAQSA